MNTPLKAAGNFSFANPCCLGNLRNGYVFGIMGMNKRQHIPKPILLLRLKYVLLIIFPDFLQ